MAQFYQLFTRTSPNTIAYLKMIPNRLQERLTLNEEPKTGHPYTSHDHYDELPVPNGHADGSH